MKIKLLVAGLMVTFSSWSLSEQTWADGPLKSGIAVGQFVSSFESIKCGGAAKDGEKVGSQLCYICKYDQRPVVLIFARKSDAALARLVKQLDKLLEKHQGRKLAGIVSLIGAKPAVLKSRAKTFASRNKLKRVPIVVPVEAALSGPKDFQLNPAADFTVMMYVKGVIKANRAFTSKELTAKAVNLLLTDVRKILK